MAPTIPALPLLFKQPEYTKYKSTVSSRATVPRQSLAKLDRRSEEPTTPKRRIAYDTAVAVTPIIGDLMRKTGSSIGQALIDNSPNTSAAEGTIGEDNEETPPPYKAYVKVVFIDRRDRIRLIEPFTAYNSVTALFESAIVAGILGHDSEGLSVQIPGWNRTGVILKELDGVVFEKVKKQVEKLCKELEESDHNQRRKKSRVEVRGVPLPVRPKKDAW